MLLWRIKDFKRITITRKSSCVNARGIPTAAYQVLHLFPEVGYPPPPQPGLMGGVPKVGYPPGRGYPPARSDGGTQGGYPLVPPRAGPGWGTLPPRWTWLGYPPVWTDRLMDGWTDTCENITFPSYYVRGR